MKELHGLTLSKKLYHKICSLGMLKIIIVRFIFLTLISLNYLQFILSNLKIRVIIFRDIRRRLIFDVTCLESLLSYGIILEH